MAITVVGILNQSLRRIGYPTPIGSIYEGSTASRVALEIYGQTRDALLSEQDWPFARQAVSLLLLKTAPVGGYAGRTWTPAYPPPPWIYEYAYPPGCIMLRSVRPTSIVIPELDPRPWVFALGNDQSLLSGGSTLLLDGSGNTLVLDGVTNNVLVLDGGGATAASARVLFTNLPDAQAVMTGQVVNPSEYDTEFTEALIAALALRFQESLAPDSGAVHDRASEKQSAAAKAGARTG